MSLFNYVYFSYELELASPNRLSTEKGDSVCAFSSENLQSDFWVNDSTRAECVGDNVGKFSDLQQRMLSTENNREKIMLSWTFSPTVH